MRAMTLTLLLAVALVTRAAPPQREASVVDFELIATKHIAIQIKVNGHGPYRVIFDTGAPAVLLSNKIADEAELRKSTRRSDATKAAFPGQHSCRSIELGDLKVDNVPAIVFDHPTIKAIEKIVGPIEGIVGYPLFGRFAVTVDYSKKQLTLVPNGHVPDDVNAAMMKSLFARSKVGPVIVPAGQWGLEVAKSGDQPGVEVTRVLAGSAAAAAGLQVGDRLVTAGGRWTESIEDCFRVAAETPVGRPVTIGVSRAGRPLTLSLTPRAGL